MPPKRAAIYTRISDDSGGSGLGVARQRDDCHRLAKQLGWTIWDEYTDNDTSAYRSRVRRRYEAMLADLEAGRVDGILCWDIDRLTRSPVELERIIDLTDRHSIPLASVGGEIDLATPQGRLTARIKGSVARHESEQTSRRVLRLIDENIKKGRPHGRTGYGWRREPDGSRSLVPEQAAIVAEIVDRVLVGESISRITRDLNTRGVPSPEGRSWQRAMVRKVALRASNAGLRSRNGKIVGEGRWPPIVSREQYERVTGRLADPGRRFSIITGHQYLLSGIARCGKCGGPMRVIPDAQGRKSYACAACRGVRRTLEPVDNLITGLVIARLKEPDALTAFTQPDDDTRLYAEADRLEDKLAEAAYQYAHDKITASQLECITAEVYGRLEEVKAQIRQLPPHLGDLVQPGMVWDELPIERKRAIVSFLLNVTILPARRRGAPFDAESVEVSWRVGEASAASPPPRPSGEPPSPVLS